MAESGRMAASEKILIGPPGNEMELTGHAADAVVPRDHAEMACRVLKGTMGTERYEALEQHVIEESAKHQNGQVHDLVLRSVIDRAVNAAKKSVRTVQLPCPLSAECRDLLERNFPMLNFKSGTNYNGHANAANIQKAYRSFIYYLVFRLGENVKMFEEGHQPTVYLKSVGGKIEHTFDEGITYAHACSPLLDVNDAERRSLTDMRLSTDAKFREYMENYGEHVRCKKKAQDCKVSAKYMTFEMSTFDMEVPDICKSMLSANAEMGYITVWYPPELLIKNGCVAGNSGRLPVIDMRWHVTVDSDGDYEITYNFPDGSHPYRHKLRNVEELLACRSYICEGTMYLFSIQVCDSGLFGIRVLRLSESMPDLHYKLLRDGVMIPLRQEYNSFQRIEYVRYTSDLGGNIESHNKKFSSFQKRSGMALCTIIVPKDIYDRGCLNAMGLGEGQFLPKNIFMFLSAWNSQSIFVNGSRVSKSEKLTAEDVMELATIIWCVTYVKRYEQSQTVKGFQHMENEYREYQGTNCAGRLKHCVMNAFASLRSPTNLHHRKGGTPFDDPAQYDLPGVFMALIASGYEPRVTEATAMVYGTSEVRKVEGKPYRYLMSDKLVADHKAFMEGFADTVFRIARSEGSVSEMSVHLPEPSAPELSLDACARLVPFATRGDKGACGYECLFHIWNALFDTDLSFKQFLETLAELYKNKLPKYCDTDVMCVFAKEHKVFLHIHREKVTGTEYSWIPCKPEQKDAVFHLRFTGETDSGHWDLLHEPDLIKGNHNMPMTHAYGDMMEIMDEWYEKNPGKQPPKVELDVSRSRGELKMREFFGYLGIDSSTNILDLCSAPGNFSRPFETIAIKSYSALSLPVSKKGVPFDSDLPSIVKTICADVAEATTIYKGSKFQLILADGSVENEDYFQQEKENFKLISDEIAAAKALLDVGGSVVLKLFDIQTANTTTLISEFVCHFSSYGFLKPASSSKYNREKYLICRGFKQVPDGTFSPDEQAYNIVRCERYFNNLVYDAYSELLSRPEDTIYQRFRLFAKKLVGAGDAAPDDISVIRRISSPESMRPEPAGMSSNVLDISSTADSVFVSAESVFSQRPDEPTVPEVNRAPAFENERIYVRESRKLVYEDAEALMMRYAGADWKKDDPMLDHVGSIYGWKYDGLVDTNSAGMTSIDISNAPEAVVQAVYAVFSRYTLRKTRGRFGHSVAKFLAGEGNMSSTAFKLYVLKLRDTQSITSVMTDKVILACTESNSDTPFELYTQNVCRVDITVNVDDDVVTGFEYTEEIWDEGMSPDDYDDSYVVLEQRAREVEMTQPEKIMTWEQYKCLIHRYLGRAASNVASSGGNDKFFVGKQVCGRETQSITGLYSYEVRSLYCESINRLFGLVMARIRQMKFEPDLKLKSQYLTSLEYKVDITMKVSMLEILDKEGLAALLNHELVISRITYRRSNASTVSLLDRMFITCSSAITGLKHKVNDIRSTPVSIRPSHDPHLTFAEKCSVLVRSEGPKVHTVDDSDNEISANDLLPRIVRASGVDEIDVRSDISTANTDDLLPVNVHDAAELKAYTRGGSDLDSNVSVKSVPRVYDPNVKWDTNPIPAGLKDAMFAKAKKTGDKRYIDMVVAAAEFLNITKATVDQVVGVLRDFNGMTFETLLNDPSKEDLALAAGVTFANNPKATIYMLQKLEDGYKDLVTGARYTSDTFMYLYIKRADVVLKSKDAVPGYYMSHAEMKIMPEYLMRELEKAWPKNLDKVKIIESHEGVPGCGKTTMIVDKVVKNDLVLTTSREGKDDIKKKLRKKGKENTVLTVDSCLMNCTSRVFKKDSIIHVDEYLMKHAGAVAWLALISGLQVICYGDKMQIPYVERNQTLANVVRNSAPTFINVKDFSSTTYRCPKDTTMFLNTVYDEEVITTSEVERSMSVEPFVSIAGALSCIPTKHDPSDWIVLTYTQIAKEEVKSELKKRRLEVKCKTVHECQGKTVANVIFIRTTVPRDADLYRSKPHILVGLTRHTKTLRYYTPAAMDNVTEIIDSTTLAGAGVKTGDDSRTLDIDYVTDDSKAKEVRIYDIRRNSGGECKTERRHYGTNYLVGGGIGVSQKEIETAATEIKYVTFNTPDEVQIFGCSAGYLSGPQVTLPKQRYSANYMYPGNSYPPYSWEQLQMYYNIMVPSGSTCNAAMQKELVKMCPIVLGQFSGKLCDIRARYENAAFDYMTPMIWTSIQPIRERTLVEEATAASKRNLEVPLTAVDTNAPALSDILLDEFIKAYIDPEKAYIASEPISFSREGVCSWMIGQGHNILKEIEMPTVLPMVRTSLYEFSLKRTTKPSMNESDFLVYPALQTIAAHPKYLNAFLCPIIRAIKEKLLKCLNEKVQLFFDLSPSEFAKAMDLKFPTERARKFKHIELDISKYDKSQGYTALLFEMKLLRYFGLDEGIIDLIYSSSAITTLKSYTSGLKMNIPFQRKSGESRTLFGNTVFNMAICACAYDMGKAAFSVFQGDDSVIWTNEKQRITTDVFFANMFSLCVKEMRFEYVEFCSKWLLPVEGQWIFFPKILKVVTKLGRHDVRSREQLEEYRTSLLDLFAGINHVSVFMVVSAAMEERYQRGYDSTAAIGSILALLHDRQKFHSLFFWKAGARRLKDPSSPTLA